MKKKLLLLLVIWLGYKGVLYYNGNFSPFAITYEWSEKQHWYPDGPQQVNEKQAEIILDQPFYFYSQGNQSYAFISKDKKYILKFFKFAHLKPSFWQKYLPDIYPLKYLKIERQSQIRRLQKLYKGHWIADTYDQKNCGIVLSNINLNRKLDPLLHVYDRLGISYHIDPKTTPFIIQKKAVVARELFHKYLKNNDLEGVERIIDEIFTLYLNEYQQGVYDRDHNVIDNIGFLEESAIRIDVGKLQYDTKFSDKDHYLPDIEDKVIKRIKRWSQTHYPTLFPQISKYLDAKLQNLKQGSSYVPHENKKSRLVLRGLSSY